MATFIQEAKSINYKNPSPTEAIKYGEVVALKDMIGVAAIDIAPGAVGVLTVSGAFEMDAETTAAFAVGQKVYWDSTAKTITASATGAESAANIVAGYAIEEKAVSAAKALVKIGG